MEDIAYASALELAAAVRNKSLSPVELVELSLDRILERNESLNAVIFDGSDSARLAAKRAERQVSSGEKLGPLHGVPSLLKDAFGTKAGWPSTYGGIMPLAESVDERSCIFALRAEEAGVIFLGKTNAPVMGFRGTCDNYTFGPTYNPFDLTRNSGGSSGGAAAAVADGLVSFAHGGDGGGSVRIPAAWCGIYGFKPSWGRVPVLRRPNRFNINPFTSDGPLTRTVADAAAVIDVISGFHPLDPFSLTDALNTRRDLGNGVVGWRIAYSRDLGTYPIEGPVADLVHQAVLRFEDLGATVEEIPPIFTYTHGELSDLWCRMTSLLSVDALADLGGHNSDLLATHERYFPPEYVEWIARARAMSGSDIAKDGEMRTRLWEAVQGVFERYDLIVTPTVSCTAVANADDGNTLGPDVVDGTPVDPLIGWALTHVFNSTGHPAASIPVGLTGQGLPVGLQVIGPARGDGRVISASAAYEEAHPWADSYAQCRSRSLVAPGGGTPPVV